MSSLICENAHSPVCVSRETGGMIDHQQEVRRWIAEGLKKPGKAKRRLADALELDPSAVTRILDGTRMVKLHEVPKIATYLGEQPPEIDGLYEGDSQDEGQEAATVPIRGYVGAGASAHFLPQEVDLGWVTAPPGATEHTVALEIRGTSMGPLLDRWLVFVDDIREPVAPGLIGQTCLVGLADGRLLVKKLKTAADGMFDLLSNTEGDEPIRAVSVKWATPVKSMMAPSVA